MHIPFFMPLGGSLVLSLLLVVPVWRIFARAGLNPALSLLIFIPVVGLVAAAAVLGLSRWETSAPGNDDDGTSPAPPARP